jgi:ACS family hexuronate transporter-like MFS transporter
MTPSPIRWWVCGLLLAATTVNYLDRVTLNQTATDLKRALAVGDKEYARLESGFSLAFAAGAVLFGAVADKFGVWRTYPVAVLGWSLAGFLTGFAPTYWAVFGCRVFLGLCEAGNWPCGIRTVRQVMPPAERSLGNAIFQSGTGLGAMLTPLVVAGCLAWAGPDHPAAWQVPFRVIGLIGLVWIAVWLVTVPRSLVDADPEPEVRSPVPFAAVLADRRFWLLAVLIAGVNTPWHTFRVWLPQFLEHQRGFDRLDVQRFSFAYYAVADVGSWLAGGTVAVLAGRGLRLGVARLGVFAVGVTLAGAAVLLPWHERLGPTLTAAAVLAAGAGSLSLFAFYFALSQDLSGRHQGKVTGVLGAVNWVYMAGLYEVQGRAAAAGAGYDRVLAAAVGPAVVALVVVGVGWPRDRPTPG